MKKEIKMRVKAFSGEGIRDYRVLVDNDDVLVWDSVAGHYTTCHSLCGSAIKRAKRLAK